MISVIVPIYNVEKLLSRCIDSIINQTYRNLEIILVNDGSPDSCAEICNQYSMQDSRIKVIHKKNGGVSSARNSGIEVATGDFVLFVDSDDYLNSNMCEVLILNQERTDSDIVVCGYKSVNSNNNIEYRTGIEYIGELNEFGKTFSKLLEQNLLNVPWNKLFKRSFILEMFDTEMDMGEDLVFNLNYLGNLGNICSIKDTLYNYYDNKNSATNNGKYIPINETEKFYRRIINFCEKSFNWYDTKPIYKEFMDSLFSTVHYISSNETDYMNRKNILRDCSNNKLLNEIYLKGSFYSNYEKKLVCGFLIKHKFENIVLLYFFCRNLIKKAFKKFRGI